MRDSGDEVTFSSKGLDDIEWKTPSVFNLSYFDTPAMQLAYARWKEEDFSSRGARRAYNAVVRNWHNAPEAVEAQLGVARMCERTGLLRRAFLEYDYAIRFFAEHLDYDVVLEKQFAIANQLRSDLGGGFLMLGGGEATADEVIDMFRRIVRNAPAWSRAPECYFMMGLTSEEAGDYDGATRAYEALLTRYPDSDLRETAMFRLAMGRYAISRKNQRDENALRNAITILRFFEREYPSHLEIETVQEFRTELQNILSAMHYQRARYYDRIKKNPSAAIVMYREFLRQFPDATESERVQERIAELEPLVEMQN